MQEWYLMTPETRPNITGGFENDAFLDYKGLISFSWTMLWSLLSTIVLYICKRFKL